jgi:hypothetical protein
VKTVRVAAKYLGLCFLIWPAAAAELQPVTVHAFDEYVRKTEARLENGRRPGQDFLWSESSPERLRRVREGEIVIAPWNGDGQAEIDRGLVHDWVGAIFVPGVTLENTIALLEDYDHHERYYKPEVTDSKILNRDGQRFRVQMRLLKKKVLTVVLDTEHQIEYFRLDRNRWYSLSRSSRIAEVQDAGQPGERDLPVGQDHGFLWRLNSYWRFQESGGGVIIECEAVSLTRAVPAGLAWLIDPIICNLPRESLANTLRATRSALLR